MQPLTGTEIRRSFVNCSRGEAERLTLPDDVADTPWSELDLYTWVDARSPRHAYLVLERHGRPLGVRLRRNAATGPARARMCSLCCTVHPRGGVTLVTAARAGSAGRRGGTVGTEACHDLRCASYVQGRTAKPVVSLLEETMSVEDQLARLLRNVGSFVDRVLR